MSSPFILGVLADAMRQLLDQSKCFSHSLALDHQPLPRLIPCVTGFPDVIIIDDALCVSEQMTLLEGRCQLCHLESRKMLIVTAPYRGSPKS